MAVTEPVEAALLRQRDNARRERDQARENNQALRRALMAVLDEPTDAALRQKARDLLRTT